MKKLIAVYLLAIVAANLSIAYFGANSSVINAFLFIGLDLSTRDKLHESFGHGKALWLRMLALIATGSIFSAILNYNAAPIAIASFVAFLAAGIADTATYAALGERSKLAKMNGSNAVSAAVDSVIFPYIAFGGFLWPIVLGQFVAKVAGGFIWALILERLGKKGSKA